MAPPAVPTPAYSTDPGVLFYAPLGTAEPANTVAGGVFTDAWPAAFLLLGATDAGHTFNFQTTAEPIEFAEYLDPVGYSSTGRQGSVAFALGHIAPTNLKRALNGGTLTTTGTAATTKSEYTPPRSGQEIRCMLGWESIDSKERYIWYRCFNTGQVSITRNKGAGNKALIPVEYVLEQPAGTGTVPFKYVTAGPERV